MKSYRLALFALAALSVASCAEKARVHVEFEQDMAGRQIVVRQLDANVYRTLDTVTVSAGNTLDYTVPVAKGQPEFIYLFKDDSQIAALLLETGEKAVVKADTLGNYSVEGSEGSVLLSEVNARYAGFVSDILAAGDDATAMGQAYIRHYRESVRYIMAHPYSMTVIPVLYESLNNLPLFAQTTDALFFRGACDSLKTLYPDSRYVKALDKEAARREQMMSLQTRIDAAEPADYPDLSLPDINGRKVALSEVNAKVVLVHFWDSADAAQKMLNLDALLPLYERYSSKGFEIYSVCLTPDKAGWASVVSSQNLPWINVNDGLGAASPAVLLYNITRVPQSFIIAGGSLSAVDGDGVDGLAKQIARLLK